MRYSNSIGNLMSIMVYLIPFALLTGPFLPDLFCSIVAICFIYISVIEKEYKYYNSRVSIFLIMMLGYFIISSILSENIFFSLKSSLLYFRFIIFSFAVWFLIENKKNFLNIFRAFLIASFVLAIFSGFYQFFYGETILGKTAITNRLMLLGSDRLLLGQYLARLFPLLVALIVIKDKFDIKDYFIIFFLFISSDVIIYLSGERTALGLMLFSSIFILLLISKLRLFRIITLISSIIIIIFITILNPSIKERNIDQTINQMGLDGKNKIHLFSYEHENFYRTSIEIFKHNYLFGIGPNNFRNDCENKDYNKNTNLCSTHPHHTYFQVIAELGLIGVIFLLLIIYYFLQIIFKHMFSILKSQNRNLSDYQVCLICCFMCTLFPLLPSLNLFNNYINIIYYLPLGFLLHSFIQMDSKVIKK